MLTAFKYLVLDIVYVAPEGKQFQKWDQDDKSQQQLQFEYLSGLAIMIDAL